MHMADTAMAVQASWTRLRPLIVSAIPLMGGTHEEGDLIKAVLAGEMTFWPSRNAFALACIARYPRLTQVHLLLANGVPEEIGDLENSILAWGETLGATELVTFARPGIERRYAAAAEARGFKKRRSMFVRSI